MSAPLAAILEGTIEADCPQVEVDELRTNSDEIGAALHALGYRTAVVSCTLDTAQVRQELEKLNPSVVFNLVDSIEGRDKLAAIAPMLLTHMGLPYTGANALATTISSDKVIAKQILNANNICTAAWLTQSQIEAGGQELENPYILKSITEHASFGMCASSVVSDRATLKKRMQEKQQEFGSEWFAEEFIEGREFNLAMLATDGSPGVRAMSPAEILFTTDYPEGRPRFIDYAAKWYTDTPEYKGTPRRFDFGAEDTALLASLTQIGLACWQAFGLGGYARVDFRVNAQGVPYVIDINSNPFLTANEGFGAATRQMGMEFTQVIHAIVADAYRRASQPMPKVLAA